MRRDVTRGSSHCAHEGEEQACVRLQRSSSAAALALPPAPRPSPRSRVMGPRPQPAAAHPPSPRAGRRAGAGRRPSAPGSRPGSRAGSRRSRSCARPTCSSPFAAAHPGAGRRAARDPRYAGRDDARCRHRPPAHRRGRADRRRGPVAVPAVHPAETAASDALWQTVARGELASSYGVVRTRHLALGSTVPVQGLRDVDARIGAAAVFGMPGVDLVTSRSRLAGLAWCPPAPSCSTRRTDRSAG